MLGSARVGRPARAITSDGASHHRTVSASTRPSSLSTSALSHALAARHISSRTNDAPALTVLCRQSGNRPMMPVALSQQGSSNGYALARRPSIAVRAAMALDTSQLIDKQVITMGSETRQGGISLGFVRWVCYCAWLWSSHAQILSQASLRLLAHMQGTHLHHMCHSVHTD